MPIKYVMTKSTVTSIYGNEAISQTIRVKKRNKEVKISSLQLCIESELILRYYDQTQKDGKRWFFNTVDTVINNIIELGK